MTEFSEDQARGFTCSAGDPDGAELVIQVVSTFGVAGPVFIAGADPLAQGRGLRLVNRLLARMQRPKAIDGTALLVTRVADDEVVHHEEVEGLERGRAKAEAIAAQITAGTFATS